jgi:FixJ family two-component response regulator
MTAGDASVCVVEDDAPLRASLQDLLGSVGLRVAAFASAQEFLRSTRPEVPSCLVLDVRLPGLSGAVFRQSHQQEGDKRDAQSAAHSDCRR